MKKLSVILSLVIASFLFFTTSCGQNHPPQTSDTSSSLLGNIGKKIIKDTEKGNFNAIIALYSKELSDEKKAKLTKELQKEQKSIMNYGVIKTIEISGEGINDAGDIVDMEFEIKFVNGEVLDFAYDFIMEDGKWKLSDIY